MRGKKMDVVVIRQILQRLREKESLHSINRTMHTHRRTLREVQEVAKEHKWLDPSMPMPNDMELLKALDRENTFHEHILDTYRTKIAEWHEKDISAVVIQRLLRECDVDVDVQAIRRFIRRCIPRQVDPVMVRSAEPGKDADVDFGDLGVFLDDNGCARKVFLFSLRLRYSRKAYRELIMDQQSKAFTEGHVRAFEFFGGVPENMHPDNTKCAVIKSSLENEFLNRVYQSCAEHYQCIISPCKPYTPQHKGGVEKDVSYVKHNFIAYFRAQQLERGVKVPRISDLKEAFEKWKREVDDTHKIQGMDKTPIELFEEERFFLKPLPAVRWEHITLARCTVRSDWRVMWNAAFYSVPHGLIGKEVDLSATSTIVKIFHDSLEVAMHEKATKKWQYLRNAEHAPPYKEDVLQWSKEGLLDLSREIGPHVYQYVEKLFSSTVSDKRCAVRSLLRLAEKYSREDLEKACKRGCCFQLSTYYEIKSILEKGLHLKEVGENTKLIQESLRNRNRSYKYARDSKEYVSKTKSWDEQWEEKYPYSKYGQGGHSAYDNLMRDNLMDELIAEERAAQAAGREGPLGGHIPEITEAWKLWNKMGACFS